MNKFLGIIICFCAFACTSNSKKTQEPDLIMHFNLVWAVSEKDNNPEERQEIIGKYGIGDEIECSVAGIVNFGIFLKVEEGLEGLVHISEIDWGLVEDPRSMFKVGDKIKAKIIKT